MICINDHVATKICELLSLQPFGSSLTCFCLHISIFFRLSAKCKELRFFILTNSLFSFLDEVGIILFSAVAAAGRALRWCHGDFEIW